MYQDIFVICWEGPSTQTDTLEEFSLTEKHQIKRAKKKNQSSELITHKSEDLSLIISFTIRREISDEK